MPEYERGKAARARELCHKLKPDIGQQADRIWMAYVAEDETGKGQLLDYLEILATQHFHGSLDDLFLVRRDDERHPRYTDSDPGFRG